MALVFTSVDQETETPKLPASLFFNLQPKIVMNGLFKPAATPRHKLIRLSLFLSSYDKLPLDSERLREIGESLLLPYAEISEILTTDHSEDLKRLDTPEINRWCLDVMLERCQQVSYKYYPVGLVLKTWIEPLSDMQNEEKLKLDPNPLLDDDIIDAPGQLRDHGSGSH